MDLVTCYKEKLAHFRIKELKNILTQLGLSKQGKKQDLVDRILAIISDDRVSGMWAKKNAVRKEEVAKLVDDIYRKLQIPGATDLASKSQSVSNVTINTTFKEESVDTCQIETVRCPCGSSLQADSMIKCEDKKCNVWQHIGCVIIPEKPMEGILPSPPPTFYCELCRLGRADPFWVNVGHPVYPAKLTIASAPTDGSSPVQNIEKTFQLTKADRDLLAKPEFELQVWCMLLNDKVSFRMQWPQYAELHVNGIPVRAINRPGSQLLGANGRDDGSIIMPYIRDGSNKISLTGCDARVFCLGVRIVRRRTLQQILNLIPKESDGERFEDAVARVCRCVGGGAPTENADSDSDLEVVSDSIPVNLRCPMSGSRMKIAGRFKPCAHMGCFDLEVFVQMNQRSRKWQCPICLKNYALENVIIDPYFTRITTKMRNCEEDVTDIEVKPDGSWRVKTENDQKSSGQLGQLGQWHLPDGTPCVPMEIESKPKPEPLKQVKQEVGSAIHNNNNNNTCLKLGIKKNSSGIWEVSKPVDKLPEKSMNNGHNDIPISSSASGSGRDGEGHFGHFTTDKAHNNIPMSSSASGSGRHGEEGHFGHFPTDKADVGDADVIVLSDSDDDIETLINDGNSCLGLFNSNDDDDFGVPFWSLPSTSQVGPSFQLFGSENENVEINDGLVDNLLAFGHNDPSLQLFLPTKPSEAAVEIRDQPPTVSQGLNGQGLNGDDWISLRLGGGGGGGGAANGLNSSQKGIFPFLLNYNNIGDYNINSSDFNSISNSDFNSINNSESYSNSTSIRIKPNQTTPSMSRTWQGLGRIRYTSMQDTVQYTFSLNQSSL